MKYLLNKFDMYFGVSLPVGMQVDIAYEVLERVQNNSCCSYIYEYEWMKMEGPSYMIKDLPCSLHNFQAAIYASLLLAKSS